MSEGSVQCGNFHAREGRGLNTEFGRNAKEIRMCGEQSTSRCGGVALTI